MNVGQNQRFVNTRRDTWTQTGERGAFSRRIGLEQKCAKLPQDGLGAVIT